MTEMARSEQSIKSFNSDSDTETSTPSHSQQSFQKTAPTNDSFTPGHNPLERDRVFLQRIYEHLSKYRRQKLRLIYFGFLLSFLQAISNVSSKMFPPFLSREKEETARQFLKGPLGFIDIAADSCMILISVVVFLFFSQREVRKSARLIAATPVIYRLIMDVKTFIDQPRTFWFHMSIHGYYNICSLIIVLGSTRNLDWRLIVLFLNVLTFVSLFINFMTPASEASNVLMEIRIDGHFVLVLIGRLAFKYLIARILESEAAYNVTKYQVLKERTLKFYHANNITAGFFRSNLSKDIMICVKGLEGIVASLENSPIFACSSDKEKSHITEIIEIMISSHSDLERIFNNLIDLQCLSDKTTLVFEPSRDVNLCKLCFQIAQEMTMATNMFIHFDDIDFDPEFGIVTIDIVQLTKALAHLLDNAVKYANAGRITLRVSTVISQKSLIPAGFLEILVPGPEDSMLQKNMAQSFLFKTLSLNCLSQYSLDSVGSKASDQLDDLTVDKEQVLTLSFNQEEIKRKSFGRRSSFRMSRLKEHSPPVYYKFVVEDEGYGLDPKVWNALKKHQAPFAFKENFDRRLEGKAGTGLGLLTVSKIVERMNGNLELRSRKGRGTAVEITLPGTLK